MSRYLDSLDAFRIARERIRANYGNQRCFAEALGITPQHVSDMLSGRRTMTHEALRACGLRRREIYELVPIPEAASATAGERT